MNNDNKSCDNIWHDFTLENAESTNNMVLMFFIVIGIVVISSIMYYITII